MNGMEMASPSVSGALAHSWYWVGKWIKCMKGLEMTSPSLSGALAHSWYLVKIDEMDERNGDDEQSPVRRLGAILVLGEK